MYNHVLGEATFSERRKGKNKSNVWKKGMLPLFDFFRAVIMEFWMKGGELKGFVF